MPVPVVMNLQFGLGRVKTDVRLQPAPDGGDATMQSAGELGHWPAAWLGGLGTPWNTLQLAGVLRIASRDLSFEWTEGRLRIQGEADMVLENVASRVTTLDRLGSYRLGLQGDAQGLLQMQLTTLDGALQLSGQGGMSGGRMRFLG